jgi:hypothetical protein
MQKPTREIVRDSSRWDQVRNLLQANAGTDSALPSFDFSRHMVVVVALGERGSTGHNIVVDSIATTKSNYLVFVSATAPEGCIGGGMIVRPVDVAQVPRSTLPIRFVERIVTHRC